MTLQDALGLHRAGRFVEAEQAYRQLLAAQPSHPHALHYYGVLRAQQGDMAGSAELVRRALTLMPDDALAHFHLAEALRELGNAGEAAEHFAAATRGRPDFAEAYAGLAAMLVESKAWDDALVAADKALALKPELAVAVMARGRSLCELQRLDEALSAFDQAITLAPGAEGLVNRGWVLFQLGRLGEALAALDQALLRDPGAMLAHSNRGSVLMALGRSEEALAAFQQGLAADPTAVAAYYNFGAALLTLGRYDAAVAAFDSVLALDPAHGEAAYNKARALELSRNPNFLVALEQAAAIAPDLGLPASRLFVEKSLRCDWRQRDEELARLVQMSRAGQLVDVAVLIGAVDDPALHLQAAKRMAGPARAPLYRAHAARRERLRIGYLSPDFRDHPVAHQIVEVLERHDRARFEVIGLSTQSGEVSPIRTRLIAAFAEFHEVEGLTDQALAEQIAALDLDILIDLGGYTQMARLTALAAKPAPVTVSYLGYPGTTGAAYIDYVLADAYCLPPEQAAFYSENIVRLPGCFFPADRSDRPFSPTRSRRDEGLPEDSFVFCCFNSAHKITPALFDIWMRLLALPKSVLWLAATNPVARANLRAEAAARGVAPERLIFAERVDRSTHLGRIGLADLFLDTLPYNAHATCSDALGAGLPLLSCSGQSFAARIAGSMLSAVGAGELIVSDLAAYEALALELAHAPQRLVALRAKIAAGRPALFAMQELTAALEAAYEAMAERRAKGQNPASFSVMMPA